MSTNNDSTQHVQIAVADPTPLGLFGLAVVTMVASAQKLGIVEGVSWVLPWALFCGSFAQLLAGYFVYCHRNIFGATIFSALGSTPAARPGPKVPALIIQLIPTADQKKPKALKIVAPKILRWQ